MDRSKWEYKKLGEVCTLLNGFAFKSDKYVDNGIRVMRITNVQKGEIVDDDPKYYPMSSQSEIQRYMLKENDLLVSLTGNVGRVGLLHRELLPAALNQRVACLRIKDKAIDLRYIFHLMNSDLFESECIANSQGIAQKNMSTKWLENYKLPVPPIADQQRIVAELDCLNEMIALKQEQLKEFDKLAQSIFYDMFGDPVTNEKGWDRIKLGDICTCITKGTTPTTLGFCFVEEGVNFVKVESFADGKIDPTKLTHITNECNKALSRSQLENEDLLVCIAGATIGKMAFVDTSILPANTNQACAIIRLKEKKSLRFIHSFLALKLKNDIIQMGKGVAQPNLSLGQLRDFTISFPPLALQQQFAEKIQAIEAQKELVKKSIAETQQLLDSRMDYYFD